MTSENNTPSPEIAALKNQVFTLLMALIVVSGTLTVYLFRQASLTGSDLGQAKKLEQLVSQNEVAIDSFLRQLVAYGQTHPDFMPILKKYSITSNSAAPITQTPSTATKK